MNRKSAQALLSRLFASGREEFYNHNHDAKGKFSSGSDSSDNPAVLRDGGTTKTYWASKSMGSPGADRTRGPYPPIVIRPAGHPEEAFSVQRPLEFVNHNHTPGRGHPNAPGAATGKLVKWSPVMSATKTGRSYVKEEEADVAKSLGAAKVGEEIRNSPHRAEVERFLGTELRGTERQAKGLPQILDEANDWAIDSNLIFHTYGEMLVAARLAKMWNNSAYQAPLRTGHLHGAELAKYLEEFPITDGRKHTFNRLGGYKLQRFIQNKFVDEDRSGEITVKEAIRLMKTDPVFREYIPNEIDEFASAAQYQWARSVSSNPSSLALMSTVARMRGHEFVETAPSKPGTHMADRGFDPPEGHVVNRTWEPVVPKSMGEFITYGLEREIAYELNRGVPYEALAYGIHAASARHLADQGLHPEDTIHIYRGVRYYSDYSMNRDSSYPYARKPEQGTVFTNPLSSWSTSKVEARAFGNRMMAYNVKVKDIFSTSATGFGSLGEEEIVPFGGPTQVTQVLLRSSQMTGDIRFNVERPLEFVNHNHTPGRGHPNAPGGYKQPELPKTKWIDTSRGSRLKTHWEEKKTFTPQEIKSMGASAVGEAIRHSPKNNMAVQEFLNRPASEQTKTGLVTKYMQDIGLKFGLGTGLKGETVGDMLVIRRLDAMVSFGPNRVMPLDHGHFGASDEAVSYFRNPPKMQGGNVSGATIAFHINYPKDATTVQEAVANLRRAGLADYIPQPEHELVARMQEAWASSATTNVASVALMHATAKQRGLSPRIERAAQEASTGDEDEGAVIYERVNMDQVRADAQREYESAPAMYDALAYGIHKASSDHIARLGLTANDKITVYRGMDPTGAGETISRGWMESGKTTDVSATMNPISSWTTDRDTTKVFGVVVFKWAVPVRDIFATSATGFGSSAEFEVVTYGGRVHRMQVHAIMGDFPAYDFSVERALEFINRNHTPTSAHPNLVAMPPIGKVKPYAPTGDRELKFAKSVYNMQFPNGIKAEVDSVSYDGEGGLSVSGTFYNYENAPGGRPDEVGYFERKFDSEPGVVHHEILSIMASMQGQGMATRFNAHAEELYKAYGIREIKLDAASTVGGYTWAVAGYDWQGGKVEHGIMDQLRAISHVHEEPLTRMQRATLQSVALGDYTSELLTPKVSKEFADIVRRVDAGEQVAPFEIAQVGRDNTIQGKLRFNSDTSTTLWAGKALLLGNTWYGVKCLDTQEKVSVNTPSAKQSDRARLMSIMTSSAR